MISRQRSTSPPPMSSIPEKYAGTVGRETSRFDDETGARANTTVLTERITALSDEFARDETGAAGRL